MSVTQQLTTTVLTVSPYPDPEWVYSPRSQVSALLFSPPTRLPMQIFAHTLSTYSKLFVDSAVSTNSTLYHVSAVLWELFTFSPVQCLENV